ncbi:MAG: peptidylprolyl isomerase [Citromicrobium sp.]|nr:peptidylprolyl isomerase [Citromicrobium sp.]
MRILFAAAATIALATASVAQEAEAPPPSPGQIFNAAPVEDWVVIDPEDLVVMTLQPLEDGTERKVVMQLISEPFSQGWVENIRTLARSEYWDGSMILRVQDNYVVQWGQPDPEMGVEPKPVPDGLKAPSENEYTAGSPNWLTGSVTAAKRQPRVIGEWPAPIMTDAYADFSSFRDGWPIAGIQGMHLARQWPVHCYGMVGVGRGMSPDTGDGSQLYTVIGHAPRHLDRNIAVVGRIVEGIEHLSSLPRGKGPLGFYEDESKRVPIVSVRMAADLPDSEQPRFEYLSTESGSFAAYAGARANRRDPFFITPAGGADICNIPVPVRSFDVIAEDQ